eukprot:XP_001700826.1 predicted protein [Chlamydomonas reinhardtii]
MFAALGAPCVAYRLSAVYNAVDQSAIVQLWRDTQRYSPEEIDFQERVFARSGLAPCGTHLPPNLNPACVGNDAATDLDSAAAECRLAVCGAVEGLLEKTGLRPKDIDILVTTCSIYCPTPSMASMVVNAFGMRKDVQAYHLGGMGCANGVVGINLVADLLKAHPNSTALFVCTETTTPAYYRGNERHVRLRHRLVTNLLFRMGGAAVCLTNKPGLRARAKYELLHRVAPRILTWSQLAAAALHMLQQRRRRVAHQHQYRPNFQHSTCRHFLLHAGGAKVLDGLGEALQLDASRLGPSRAVLHDYGNPTSNLSPPLHPCR